MMREIDLSPLGCVFDVKVCQLTFAVGWILVVIEDGGGAAVVLLHGLLQVQHGILRAHGGEGDPALGGPAGSGAKEWEQVILY